MTLLFQFVAPPPLPPKLKLPASARGGWIKSIEWHFVGFLLASALVQVVPTTWMVMQDWPAPKRTAEIPNKFVTLIVKKPDKPPEQPKIKEKEGDGRGEKKKDKPKEARKAVAAGDKKEADPEAQARKHAEEKRRLAKAVRGKTLLKFITAKAGDDEAGTSGLVDALAHGAARTRVDEAFAGASGVATRACIVLVEAGQRPTRGGRGPPLMVWALPAPDGPSVVLASAPSVGSRQISRSRAQATPLARGRWTDRTSLVSSGSGFVR